MTSQYLSEEECRRSENLLLSRIADEVIDHNGLLIFPEGSDYHRIPKHLQTEVQRRARRNLDAMAEHG